MTPNPVVIDGGLTIADAFTRMFQIHARHLPVVVHGHIVGVLSDRDIGHLSAVQGVEAGRVTAEQACSPNPYVVRPDTSLAEATQTLVEHKFGCALVMEDGKLVGMFSTIDAMQALVAMLRRDETQAADPAHPWSVSAVAPDDVHLPEGTDLDSRKDRRAPDLDPRKSPLNDRPDLDVGQGGTSQRPDLDTGRDAGDGPDLVGDTAGRDLVHAPDPRRDALQTHEAQRAELTANNAVHRPNPMTGVSPDVRSDLGRRTDMRRAATTVRRRDVPHNHS